jgi:recombination associated protein RdgC
MWFRNLTLFRFAESSAKSLKRLETHLEQKRLNPCGPLEFSTHGFVSPYGRDEEALVHRVGDYALLTVGREDRLLPSSVVNDELAARLKKIAEKEGRRVGSKERKRLKEDVLTDLLPRAFTKLSRTCAYLAANGGWLVLDTASRRRKASASCAKPWAASRPCRWRRKNRRGR